MSDEGADQRSLQDSLTDEVRNAAQESAEKARRMLANPRRTRR